jgi:Ni/Co efflux regulator RcnB
MLKTISAALIAVSMLAAPAMASGFGHGSRATHSHALDAKAQMHRGHVTHHRHVRPHHPHFNFHKKFGHHKHFKHSAITAKTVHKHG